MALPADPNDGSLLSGVFIGADEDAYGRAADLWSMTGLPVPEYEEYYSSDNADRVYMSSHGLCFSFVYRRPDIFKSVVSGLFGARASITAPVFEARKISHERILQPLLQVDLGSNCCFEIVPGVERVGADKGTLKAIARSLKEDRIHFYSPEPEYVGILRGPAGGDIHHLVVNRRSIKPLGAEALESGPDDAGLQNMVYGALREQFAEAFSAASGEKFQSALAECARIAALPDHDNRKILHDHWNGRGPQSYRRMQIAQAAKNYALHLAA